MEENHYLTKYWKVSNSRGQLKIVRCPGVVHQEENHKGQICIYTLLLCQEGLCSECAVAQRYAVLCPVCNGNGLVSNGFYSHPGDYPYWVSASVNMEQCKSCNGKGWVNEYHS